MLLGKATYATWLAYGKLAESMDDAHSPSSRSVIEPSMERPGYVIASVGNLAIAVTRQPPSLESIREFTSCVDALCTQFPDGVAVLIAPRGPRPSLTPEAGRAIVSSWRRLEPCISCSVVLFRSSGFVSAIQRSLTTALLGMHQSSVPLKASANPFEAADFIVRHEASHAPAGPLGVALQAFVRRYES
ncbi:MAG TPA: hypothetical protein PKD61_10190 [Polyangiaceae bacterium]|nr:hypothetical protein [Polyangiaceae bacterium]